MKLRPFLLAFAVAAASCAEYPALPEGSPPPVAVLAPAPAGRRAERVVIVSIDGLRPDAIEAASAETLKRLIARGAYCAKAQTVRPSVTLPSHTSMLTGLDPARHQVTWNSYHRGYLPHPTVFSVVAQSGKESAMFFSKDKFHFLALPSCVSTVVGPPVPDRPAPPEDYTDPKQQDLLLRRQREAALLPSEANTTAEKIARAFSELWPARPLALTFVHFREADVAGHRRGWMSLDYLEALATVDRALSSIVDTIERHGGLDRTAIIVTSDHGGSGHDHYWFLQPGKEEHMTIPWICVAPGLPAGRRIDPPIRIYDTAPTALALLGLGAPEGIDGRVVDDVLRE